MDHRTNRRNFLQAAALAPLLISACSNAQDSAAAHSNGNAAGGAAPKAASLIQAARGQIGVTNMYDPSYSGLEYPGGDVPRVRGVCTDVVIRAYRDALGVDLQKLVHEDMQANFAAYPENWGLTRPDRNIDHRRVPNLRVFLKRMGAALPVTRSPADWKPGDIFTSMVGGRLPHIGIVSERFARDGTPLAIHNIGSGTREENVLFAHKLNGHFRWMLA